MAYLEQCPFQEGTLLDRVGALSTVSGGTITSMVWALKKQQGASFQEIYDFLLGKLQQLDLVAEGLQKLQPEGVWQNAQKTKNLINAFAELYDREFTGGATFEVFTDSPDRTSPALVFNATEFSHGINFRFQNKGRFGNNYHPISKEVYREIKLADVIAASSCFPGGFEPMAFPHDFRHAHSPALEQLSREPQYQPPLGLMDGGINDNQGIDSLLKRIRPDNWSLLLISDVASSAMTPFARQEAQPPNWLRSLTYEGALKAYQRLNRKLMGGLILWTLLWLGVAVLEDLPTTFGVVWALGCCWRA